MNASGHRVRGKVALVTGGASGIGLATVRALVRHGAEAVIADIDVAAAERAAAEEEALSAVALDITQDASWTTAMHAVVTRFGRLDAVVNSAGIAIPGDVETISLADWALTMRVNVDGVFLGCRHAVAAMKATGGSIVNLSSVSGIVGGANMAAYNASKGAVRLLTKSVALHCAKRRYGIRCNSVHPTFVDTPMLHAMLAGPRDPEATLAALVAQVPLGRIATPDEIADLIVYLVADESRFVTGAEFVIDGGLTAM